jgi:hypothetical protein
VVDPALERGAQHVQRFVTVTRWSEDVVASQLHGAVAETLDVPSAERKGSGGLEV